MGNPMNSISIICVAMSVAVLSACTVPTSEQGSSPVAEIAEAPITQAEAEAIYDYAYPLVIMKLSQDVMFTVPFRARSGPNHFIHFKQLAQPEQRAVVLGNRNTLYSVGWIDLSQGPVVFEIPDMGDRYYVMPLLDAWTNTFASLGSRTTGQGAQKYFIANAAWQGDTPDGYELIISPTNMVWITGRIQADSAEDAAEAGKLHEDYILMTHQEARGEGDPLADYAPEFEAISVRKPVPYSLRMSAENYYDTFFAMWSANASPQSDTQVLDLMAKASLRPGAVSKFSDLPAAVQTALQAGLEIKQAAYTKAFYEGTRQTEPWIFNLDPNMGDWGTEYARRAYWAMWGLGTNIVEDAVYGVTQLDADLEPLNGENLYRIHFAPGTTPPTPAFWSVTNYDADGYLERNPQDRYSLGSNHALTYNQDGSLDFYLSHTPPEDVAANWVPAPAGDFKTLLRIYWPEGVVLEGGWSLPPLNKVE